MGIRYYAYAFDADQTDRALDDPRSIIASDPLADAWGFEPHARLAVTTFQQRPSRRDMLYLDKAWAGLQRLACPPGSDGPARPAYRMFEGHVTTAEDGVSWYPWVRVLVPAEVGGIAADVEELAADVSRELGLRRRLGAAEAEYLLPYLEGARAFMAGLSRDGRGMAYLIG